MILTGLNSFSFSLIDQKLWTKGNDKHLHGNGVIYGLILQSTPLFELIYPYTYLPQLLYFLSEKSLCSTFFSFWFLQGVGTWIE